MATDRWGGNKVATLIVWIYMCCLAELVFKREKNESYRADR